MSTPAVLVVGEALVDVVQRVDGSIEETPGGSPANVAIALGRLGRAPRLVTALGDDFRGAAVHRWLEASGVDVEAPPAGPTSTSSARLAEDGSATYDFDISWDPKPVAGDADALHVGSIAALLSPGAAEVSRLVDRLRGCALITYDPNIRASLIDDEDAARRRVRELISKADVVKASDEDLAWLHPGEDAVAVAAEWVQLGPALVVVTAGRAGALAVSPGRIVRVSAEPVEVVDTVGAGDTFMGALVDGLLSAGAFGRGARSVVCDLDEGALRGLLARAARAAAITVSRPGADPPTRAELDGAA